MLPHSSPHFSFGNSALQFIFGHYKDCKMILYDSMIWYYINLQCICHLTNYTCKMYRWNYEMRKFCFSGHNFWVAIMRNSKFKLKKAKKLQLCNVQFAKTFPPFFSCLAERGWCLQGLTTIIRSWMPFKLYNKLNYQH